MKRHKDSYSRAELRERGWTDELMAALLPEPETVRSFGGREVSLWKKDAVLSAERDARFPRRQPRKKRLSSAVLLERAWSAAERDESSVWRLAAQFHKALSARAGSYDERHALRESQVAGYLNDFLALEQRCDVRRLPEIWRNFLRACALLADDPDRAAFRHVLDRYPYVLRAAAAQSLTELSAAERGASSDDLLSRPDFPGKLLLKSGLDAVWSVWYVPRAIRSSLSLLLALNPKDEYPEARALRRRFVLHLGGTNTGKTYAGFQRLKQAKTGVYLAPLRLLALEAQETLLDAGIDCSLTTGEEEDRREGDTHVAATAEKLDLKARYDVAVIDECQMIADPQRGYAWTRAILGVQADEVHLCAAPEAKQLLLRLIESCGDSVEVELHRRTTPLICMSHTVDLDGLRPGDALISFSKVGVLSAAEDLRRMGKEPAIIYGALPYATRRAQVDGFLDGDMEYVVATDAIGMGLNLPIRRVIFMETEKFDGVERRELKPEEIKQIAGRAGRYGMYDRGFVGSMENLGLIRAGLDAVVPPLQYAVLGFSELVLQVDFDLLEVLTEWSKMPAAEPYRKLDISRYITLITKLRDRGFLLTREQELRAANIPFDETETALEQLFFDFLGRWSRGEAIEQPGLGEGAGETLPELEQYYRKLDLYFSFAKAFGCPVDSRRLAESRERTAEEINDILIYRLQKNIRFCERCGKSLPAHHRGRLCDACYRKKKHGGPPHTAYRRDK